MSTKQHRIVIIGAGFGGLTCARTLSQHATKDNTVKPLSITVIDRNPYQLFSPLLYQVATGGLPEDDIAYPVRAAVPGITFRRGDVIHINTDNHTVRLDDGTIIEYDELVLATGSTGSTFNVPGVSEHALQMKTIHEARTIRRRLLQSYEDVEMGKKPKESLQVIVVGGGPTGVELSGAIAELQKSMHHEYADIANYASVTLLEAGERILPMFTEDSSQHAQEALQKLGVHIKTNASVDRMYPTDVHLKNGEVHTAGTIIWAAGVSAYKEWSFLGDTDRMNRLHVNEYLQISPRIWAIGDTAYFEANSSTPLPMVAPVAIQMGKHAAQQILLSLAGKPLEPFQYKDKGQMATIGRRQAVVEMPNGIQLRGTLAWLIWLALHVFYLAGGRNRISVIADWMWNYIAWGVGPRRTVLD